MRVTSVGLYSSLYSEMIEMSLRKVDRESRYVARNIVGLDAEEVVPKFYGYGLQSKSKFYDFGMKAREIVIRVVLNPSFKLGETYSDVRDELYRAISANRTGVTVLYFKSGATTVAKIEGMIIKLEAAYFNQLPEIQLTIRCDDPMFRGINPVELSAKELGATNPVPTPDSISTAPHGFSMEITFKTASSYFTIQDVATNPDWKIRVTPTGGFAVGDKLYFSSDYSSKYLYMVRGSVTTHLIDVIEPGSVWPTIFPGANTFYFPELSRFDWNKFEYYPAYWGV